MKRLINWTARRAGGRITINATDYETKQPTKVVGVDVIEGGAGGINVVATDKNGVKYELA